MRYIYIYIWGEKQCKEEKKHTETPYSEKWFGAGMPHNFVVLKSTQHRQEQTVAAAAQFNLLVVMCVYVWVCVFMLLRIVW